MYEERHELRRPFPGSWPSAHEPDKKARNPVRVSHTSFLRYRQTGCPGSPTKKCFLSAPGIIVKRTRMQHPDCGNKSGSVAHLRLWVLRREAEVLVSVDFDRPDFVLPMGYSAFPPLGCVL